MARGSAIRSQHLQQLRDGSAGLIQGTERRPNTVAPTRMGPCMTACGTAPAAIGCDLNKKSSFIVSSMKPLTLRICSWQRLVSDFAHLAS